MPKFIIKLDQKYAEWSTIVDAPVSGFMNLEAFRQWYKWRYSDATDEELNERLARVEKQGTSCIEPLTVDKLIQGNRAGENETELSKEELLKDSL